VRNGTAVVVPGAGRLQVGCWKAGRQYGDPPPPVFFVRADSKGVSGRIGVRAVDKGVTGALGVSLILSWKKEGMAQFEGRVRKSIAGKELACLGGVGKVIRRANMTHVSI